MAAPPRDKLLVEAERLYANRQYDQVQELCRRVLARRPNEVGALGILARIAFDKGLNDEAASHLERCVRLRPGDGQIQLTLARVLLQAGRFDEAAAIFERLLRLRPGDPAALAGKAGVLERRGRRAEALEVLEPQVHAGREDAGMAALYARLKVQEGDPRRAVEVAARHAGDRAEPGVMRALNFALGDAHEKAGDYDAAFEAYRRAHEHGRARFDPQAVVARVDRVLEVCTREVLTRLPRARGGGTDLPVFVVGMPRSATTLVERILDAHPEAHGGGELDFMPRIADSLAAQIGSTLPWPDCILDLEQADVDRLSGEYLEQLRALSPGARRIADKQLGNDQALGLVALLCPGARVIHCRRDALDTCLSCYAHPLSPTLHPYASDLRALGIVYRQVERLMAHWASVLDLPMLAVQYEDLVADQEGRSRRIVEFCGLEWDERCLRYYETAGTAHTLSYDQVRRPIYGSARGRARHFEKHLGPLMEALGTAGPPP